MSRRDNQSSPGAFTFQHGVGGDRGAMMDVLKFLVSVRPIQLLTDLVDAMLDPDPLVLGRGGNLCARDVAGGTFCADVGECAANVGAEAIVRGCVGHGRNR